MMSAVTHEGKLYFHLKVGRAFRQPDLIRFLRRLLGHIPGEVVVFLDRGGPHRGPLLRKFLRSHPRIRLEYLPPYGFEYNPDEGVWDHLKWVRLRNFVPEDTEGLVAALRRGLRRLQYRPGRIASFFRNSKLPREDVELLLNQAGCL
jgi:transposase